MKGLAPLQFVCLPITGFCITLVDVVSFGVKGVGVGVLGSGGTGFCCFHFTEKVEQGD